MPNCRSICVILKIRPIAMRIFFLQELTFDLAGICWELIICAKQLRKTKGLCFLFGQLNYYFSLLNTESNASFFLCKNADKYRLSIKKIAAVTYGTDAIDSKVSACFYTRCAAPIKAEMQSHILALANGFVNMPRPSA